MKTADCTVHIARDIRDVFEFLRDPTQAHRWRYLVTRMEPIGSLPLERGARVRLYFQSGGPERMQEITLAECESPTLQVWRNVSDGFDLRVRFVLAPQGRGTDVRVVVDTSGTRLGTKLILPLATRGHRARFADSLDRLKRALEG